MIPTTSSRDESALLAAIEPLLLAATEGDLGTGTGADPDAELALRSIQVITLVDLLEARFDVTFTSDDVRPTHFASRRALASLLRERGATCD